MAVTLTSSLRAIASASYQSALDLGVAPFPSRLDVTNSFADGSTGANVSNLLFSDKRTLAATSEELDLAGVLLDAFGRVLTFTTIRAMVIRNTNVSPAALLKVGG